MPNSFLVKPQSISIANAVGKSPLLSPYSISALYIELERDEQYVYTDGFESSLIPRASLTPIDSIADTIKHPFNISTNNVSTNTPSLLRAPYFILSSYSEGDGAKRYVTPTGFDGAQFGVVNLKSMRHYIGALGLYSASFGAPAARNTSAALLVKAINETSYGKPLIYNLKQFTKPQGREQSSYGNAYLQGGVRWVTTRSIAPLGVGKPALLNTTANQNTRPIGIARTTVVPAPIVSPHTIYARGIYGTAFGSVKLIPTPVLRQKGLNHLVAGEPTVWFHTRPLAANGFESYATGYPRVFDPAQFIQQLPFNRTAVFGDTYAKNVWTFVKGAGAIDSQAISEWATLENKNRSYDAKGFLSQALGSQLIKNKSPSIFFHGLPAPIFYSQSIGYRVRAIVPTGFDRLSLGKPTVIKTPELFPRSYIATQFGVQWISNHTRYIENHSKNYGAAGTPTVWFRWRYANPKSWLSQVMGDKATVTHGVREVIASGFIRQAYGNAWVSRSPRLLQPTSIYKEYPSNHYVGRHQEIQPAGYIATLFGERIIPEIQAVYPLGFTGVFGLAFADLSTKYLKTIGFATAGEQPAFRWGRQIVQNSVQYITQDFIVDSGMVPPKWSEWTAIENRNKTIGAIGSLMQRFGYAQVDNNARLLAPQGLIATRFDKSMIAYRIRYVPLQGIEPPHMSDWLIVHNAARVIKPMGEVQSLFGNAEAVKTRRYFDRIGRIDSFESGAAMIAYRIRTLDIEKRYSIAPPIIRLPTVDLYTRYIEFRGYETAKYGLASLSIHFRIITPRWSHSEKSGQPALRNVTPELLTRGHDSQEYGTASIRTQWRDVYAQGDNTAAIGLLRISDTKQHLSVRGFLDSLASQKHKLTQGESAPYSLQYIYLNDENNSNDGDGKGIAAPDMGEPALNQNVIYHLNKGISSKFGTAFVRTNNLVIESGIAIQNMSNGNTVYNKKRFVGVGGIKNEILLGKPRLSPHTIWAVKEAPGQAITNHYQGRLHYVGGYSGNPTSSVFGHAHIESTIRSLRATGFYGDSGYARIGMPRLTNKKSFIRPDSFRLSRFGIPSIPFTPQDIKLRDGVSQLSFGSISVTRPPYVGPLYISMNGLSSNAFGRIAADNFIRYIKTGGHNSLLMGTKKDYDSPYMWQGLRVGELVPVIASGYEPLRMGVSTIWHRVRELQPTGFNAFSSGYELSQFRGRMTVSNATLPEDIVFEITMPGREGSVIGQHGVKLGQHFIRPDGNSEQFRKGAW